MANVYELAERISLPSGERDMRSAIYPGVCCV